MCLGIPGKIERITDEKRFLGLVDIGGVKREVNLECILADKESVCDCVGDWVLVHVGFAMSRICEKEAQETLQTLEQLGAIQGEVMQIHTSSVEQN